MSTNYKPVTHCIFDMDGLLLNTEVLYTVATQNILDVHTNPRKIYTWDVKTTLMGLQTEEVSRRIVEIYELPLTWTEYAELAMREIDVLMRNCEKCDGAERLVRHLKKHGIPIGLATSSSKGSFDVKTLNHRDLFELFDHITLGSSDPEVKNGKPAPDIFFVSAGKFPDKPKYENCLVFEDAPNGVKAAKSAGMQVVMVPDPRIHDDHTVEATQVLDSLMNFKPEDFGLPPFDDEHFHIDESI